MFIRSRRNKKALAVFFFGLLVYETCFPAVAYALTSGPTSPEAASFEPVDTTDMVNLQTGDFTYNTPLIDVPGPEGGYPVALSYHAGIKNEEEATWVGLGWSLNPGAITRSVNGYADDWSGQAQQKRDYWSGTTTTSFGVDVGITLGRASIGVGATFTNNSEKGFSVDYSHRVGVGHSIPIFNGVSLGINTSSNGSPSLSLRYASLGVTLSSEGVRGVSTSNRPSFSTRFFYSNSAQNVRSESGGWSFGLSSKIWNIGLSSQYYRTWLDNSTTVQAFGSIYSEIGLAKSDYNATSFDTYFMPDENADPLISADVEYQVGGAMPDFDNYMVNAQGISGAIRPYFYKANVAGLNRPNNVKGLEWKLVPDNGTPTTTIERPIVYSKATSSIVNKAKFRFVNDFSNSYRQQLTNFADGSLDPQFDTNPVIGDGIISGYNTAENYLEGSKHIEYFTNAEIVNQTAKNRGFVGVSPDNSRGFSRLTNSLIGGFSITAANGVTYHFALPAYENGHMTYTEKIKASSSEATRYNKQQTGADYAHTWYLTSITGPDFVDRDGNGYANEGDYGYWVNLGYGKWCSAYNWRNPGIGYDVDADNEFQSFTLGQREVYYLNNISTRTHTAIFEKDVRSDARGVGSRWNYEYGMSTPYYGSFTTGSLKTMRLNRVLLLNNEDLASISPSRGTALNLTEHFGANVYDKYDLANTGIEQKCIRIVEFNHDYSLCKNTINSFNDDNVDNKLGKLTLNSIKVLGKGGASVLPPIDFGYEDRDPTVFVGTFYWYANGNPGNIVVNTTDASKMFKEGDLLKVKTHDEKTYSVYVLAAVANGNQWTISIKYLDFIPRVNTGSLVEITHTKNPGYNREAYDKWGMFKCDFDETTIKDNQNAGRLVTAASAKHTDAWSLRKVTTQLGADLLIDYESDIIGKSVIDNRTSLVARDFVLDETNKRIAFKVDNPTGVPLNTLFPVGSKLDMALLHQAINNATRGYMQMPFITLTRDNALYFNSVATLSGYRNTTKYTRGTSGGFTVYSIDAATGTIVMNCSDPFYYGSNEVLFNQQIDTRLEKNIIAGNLYFYNNEVGGNTNYGGGIRVKELMIQDESRVYSTKYNYNSISTGAPSGVTSYEPNTTDSYLLGGRLETVFGGLPAVMDRFKAEYRAMLGQGLGKVTTLSRVLSSPNVMYEYVTVSSEVKNITANGYNVYQSPGKTTYQFVVPSETSATYKAVGSYDTNDMGTRNFVVEDNTAAVGTMKRKIDFDNLGNRLRETIVSTTNDNVLSSTRLDKYNRQGEIMERYAMQKRFRDDNGRQRNFAMTTARIEEPTITSSEKVIDHKNGATTIREFVKYDYYSGQLVQSVETDLYGNRFLTEIIPAYRQYADMSLKVLNANNKHMLTQEAGKYVYKVNAANAKQVLLTGEIQTWSNEVTVATAINSNLNTPKQNGTNGTGNVWRKQSQYIWAASGTSANNMTPIASFIDFNWANPAGANTAWRKKEEITLYDVYSKDLEAKDMNENYAAVRMGYNNTKVLMTGSNATQAELAFSGAEDAEINGRFSGYISKGDGVVQTSTTYPVATAHSGYNSLKVDGGKTGFNYTASINTAQRDIGHVASVWVKSVDGSVPNASIYYTVAGITNYGTIDPTRKSGDWYLLNIVSYYDFGSKTFGCINNGTSPVYFDDFNVHPMVSNATAYVYDKFSGQVSYIINPNNLFTRFEYDNMDRLKAVYKETLSNGVVKTQDYEYNYGKGQ